MREAHDVDRLGRIEARHEEPDNVWRLFGAMRPVEAEWTVKRALRDCDMFIAIGTSGLVPPASDDVRGADDAGASTVLVNREPMQPPNRCFHEPHPGPAETLLPQTLRGLKD